MINELKTNKMKLNDYLIELVIITNNLVTITSKSF